MRLGAISMWADDLSEFRRRLRLIEDFGFELAGIGDSPIGYHDPYVSLTLAATETKKAVIGPMVTSPHLRTPLASVRAISALYELTGGRVVFGLGAGNSIALGTGQKQPTQQHMRDYILTMRSLFEGEPVSWDGGLIKPLRHVHKVPIYYSALGPKAMRLAGEVADGVILQIGMSIEQVRDGIAAVREAAREAGRAPNAVDIWAYSVCSVAPTRAEALSNISPYLAVNAPLIALIPNGMEQVPEPLRAAMREAHRRYDYRDHSLAGGQNGTMVEELGLLEFLARIKTIAGSSEDVSTYLAQLEQAGVTLLMGPIGGQRDIEGSMRRLCEATRSNRGGLSADG